MSQDSPYDIGWAVRGGVIGLVAMVAVVAGFWWATAGRTWMRDRALRARTREFLDCVSQASAEQQAGCLMSRHGWTQHDAFMVVMHWNQPGRREPLADLLRRDLNLR